MGFLSGLIGVVFLIYLLLRISRIVGGTTRAKAAFRPSSNSPELWEKGQAEIQSLLDAMPTAWVTYDGMTPPLKLKIRGLSGDLYQTFVHSHLDAYGREGLASMPYQDQVETMKNLRPTINAEAYVLDWSGAQYPNGKPLPFSPDNLASFMRKDEMLTNFISDETGRLATVAGLAWE